MNNQNWMGARNFRKNYPGFLSEEEIRRRIIRGEVPGIHVGSNKRKFLINVPAFLEKLQAESIASEHC